MATGTPRPTILHEKSSKDAIKSWTSFDESPVHAGDGSRKEEGWMSFKDSPPSVNPNEFNNSLPVSSPVVGYAAKSRFSNVPQHQNIAPATPVQESSILNRTGIGTDKQTPIARAKPNLKHPHAELATHGPGSTINHLLRHKTGDVETDSVTDNHKIKENRPMGDSIIRSANSVSQEVPKPVPEAAKYRSSGNRGNDSPDPWFVTDEQGKYYRNQFSTMQPNLDGKIDGQTARNFFTKSRLPIPELSHIWELCDMDQDGHLTLLEFCAAFHLVVARKNGFDLPPTLPESLLPPLRKMFGKHANVFPSVKKTPVAPKKLVKDEEHAKPVVVQSPVKSRNSSEGSKDSSEIVLPKQADNGTPWVSQQEKWETFSDRTSSSTNLANFDQNLGQNDNLPHPVPLRITPSRHEMHSAKMRKDKDFAKSTDDDERSQLKYTVPPSHKSLTNPYGSLKNDFSEPDSHASPRARSSSHSSCSSGDTSDRSVSEIDRTMKQIQLRGSDQESDWSSRPLQPRSASDSSIASSLDAVDGIPSMARSMHVTANVPTPPPRPHQQVKPSKSDSVESDSHKSDESKIQSLSAPTPPPRPQQTSKKPPNQIEEFADFSRFDEVKMDELSSSQTANTATESSKSRPATTESSDEVVKSLSEEEHEVKPTPAPRHNREEKVVKEIREESSPERNAHRKAPTKPPRSTLRSISNAGEETSPKIILTSTLSSQNDDLPAIAERPSQSKVRSKTDIQQSIRNLKCRNTKLTKLNADLQQELKNVMQSRITVEMSIHQLRPFTQ